MQRDARASTRTAALQPQQDNSSAQSQPSNCIPPPERCCFFSACNLTPHWRTETRISPSLQLSLGVINFIEFDIWNKWRNMLPPSGKARADTSNHLCIHSWMCIRNVCYFFFFNMYMDREGKLHIEASIHADKQSGPEPLVTQMSKRRVEL